MKIRTVVSLLVGSDSPQTKKIETAKLRLDPQRCGLGKSSIITNLEPLCRGNQGFLDRSKLGRRLAHSVHMGVLVNEFKRLSERVLPNKAMI